MKKLYNFRAKNQYKSEVEYVEENYKTIIDKYQNILSNYQYYGVVCIEC